MQRVLLIVLAVLALPATALAQEPAATPTPTPTPTPAAEERIRENVSVAGVEIGGLTVDEATAKLFHELNPAMGKDVVLQSAGKRFYLPPAKVKFAFDARKTAENALEEGKKTPAPSSDGGGAAPGLVIAPVVKFRKKAIRRFARSAAKKVYRAPRNATVRIKLRRVRGKGARPGRKLNVKSARAKIARVFSDPALAREVKVGRKKIKPKVTNKAIKRLYPTVLTVDRNGFRLRVFKRLKLVKTYGVAVGAPGYSTPTGLFRITNKAVNPVWTAPNSPWAAEFRGQSIPGGAANNPLKARWLGIINGVGIHGTGAEYSIGSRASKGCIRMRVADVIDLYPRVPVGTPILIR